MKLDNNDKFKIEEIQSKYGNKKLNNDAGNNLESFIEDVQLKSKNQNNTEKYKEYIKELIGALKIYTEMAEPLRMDHHALYVIYDELIKKIEREI